MPSPRRLVGQASRSDLFHALVPTVFLLDAMERVEETHAAAYKSDGYLLGWPEAAQDTELLFMMPVYGPATSRGQSFRKNRHLSLDAGSF